MATSHPETVTGHALLAFAHWVGASENLADEPDRYLELARRHAREGIDRGDPTGLSQMVEAAEISRPTCDVTFALEGSTRRYLGQWERSVVSLDRAMRLTQLIKPWYPTVQACSFFIGGRFENAATTAEAVLERQPQQSGSSVGAGYGPARTGSGTPGPGHGGKGARRFPGGRRGGRARVTPPTRTGSWSNAGRTISRRWGLIRT